MSGQPVTDARGLLVQSDFEARSRAHENIRKLTALAAAIHSMIEEEQRLIAAPVPFADERYDREFSALCRAAYAVFGCEELHEMGVAYDPDWQEAA